MWPRRVGATSLCGMCGVAGVYNLPEMEGRFAEMLESLAHRGPDACGTFVSSGLPGTVLGHQRLSIIDPVEGSNQPFRDGHLVLSFNGEIYNFRALKVELEGLGEKFRTASDTEVLVKAWKVWGPECLTRLRGMFAFAILDLKTSHLYLARDPFGIKPMFYAVRDGGLAFASEAEAVLRVFPGPEVDMGGVVASLMYSWVPETRSVYKGLKKVQPGHWVEARPNGTVISRPYWDPVEEFVESPAPEPSTADLTEVLQSSVDHHLISDVPLALFLSGGLDSSLIAALASRSTGSLDAYTIAFRPEDHRFEAMPDDLSYARLVANEFGIELHEIEINPSLAEMLPKMVKRLGEPIGDPAALNTYLISEAAQSLGVKVLLSGMGADELFGGYRKHYAALLASKYRRVPRPIREHLIEPLVRSTPVASKRRGFRYARWSQRFVDFASLSEADAFQRSYSLFGKDELRSLLSPDLHPLIDDLLEEHRLVYAEGPSDDQVNRMCYTDTRLFLTSLNLAYTDRASMAASVEVRVPYVDVEVARCAFAIPGRRKIVGRNRKVVLKEAARGLLPDVVIDRPKALFSVPLRSWIRGDMREMVDSLLSGDLVRQEVLDRSSVARLIDEDRSGAADYSRQIWQLLTLEAWYQQAHPALTGSP